jgi:hypothetical protein
MISDRFVLAVCRSSHKIPVQWDSLPCNADKSFLMAMVLVCLMAEKQARLGSLAQQIVEPQVKVVA